MTDDELFVLANLMLSANGPQHNPRDLCPIVYGKPYAPGRIFGNNSDALFIAFRDEIAKRYPNDYERARKIAAVLTYLELNRDR